MGQLLCDVSEEEEEEEEGATHRQHVEVRRLPAFATEQLVETPQEDGLHHVRCLLCSHVEEDPFNQPAEKTEGLNICSFVCLPLRVP